MNIAPGTVHLWFARDEAIRDHKLLARYRKILSDGERAQQERFVFEKDRHQYLVTRALVRTVLSLYLEDLPPPALKFGKNAYNKPYIANRNLPTDLAFNISHTRNLIVVAVTAGDEVGVDVEYLSGRDNMLSIAEAYFSPGEFAEMMALKEGEQYRRFFDIWTLKEAYIKARGMGLSIPLNQFSYHFPERNKIRVMFDTGINDDPNLWDFWQVKPEGDHIAALAVRKRNSGMSHSVEIKKIIPFGRITPADYPIISRSG